MLLLPYLTFVCGLATTAEGLALPLLTDTVGGALGNVVGDVVDDLVDGAKVIISKIPLSRFGQFGAVRLADAIADPSLINKVLHNTNTNTNNDAVSESVVNTASNDADDGVADTVVRQTTTTATTEVVPCNVTTQSTRVEWYSYSAEDRHAFLDAIACLLAAPSAGAQYTPSTSRYEDFVRTHQRFVGGVHHSGLFLPWHRYFVLAFERALRGECGFDRPLPWWDETRDAGAFGSSEVFRPVYFGSLPAAVDGNGVCVTDGRFANLTCNIGPGADNVPHCLSRAGDEELTAQASAEYVAYCAERTEFGDFSSCAESGPHGWAHNGIGSVMAEVAASPGDPVFFAHHLFVDHEFASWQEAGAGASTRKSTVGGGACQDASDPCTTALTTGSVLDMNGLLPNATVGDVLDTRGGVLCYAYDRY